MNSKEQKIETLKTQITEWKRIQYRAAQMRNASQCGRANRELTRLYKQLDALK